MLVKDVRVLERFLAYRVKLFKRVSVVKKQIFSYL